MLDKEKVGEGCGNSRAAVLAGVLCLAADQGHGMMGFFVYLGGGRGLILLPLGLVCLWWKREEVVVVEKEVVVLVIGGVA